MPNASHRAEDMPASPIRRLVPLAVAAERRGVHVHYLNIGQPDVLTPTAFWDGIRDGMLPTLAYSPSPGVPSLRKTAVADYQRRGFPIEADDFLVTTGGSEATLWAFMVCCDPGDEVIVVEPFYANYAAMAIESGVTLVAVTTRIEDEFASRARLKSKPESLHEPEPCSFATRVIRPVPAFRLPNWRPSPSLPSDTTSS